jgi:hypothetical protein
MYEYTFVRCPVTFLKAGKINEVSYREVIKEHAAQGWRLVQMLVENPAAVPSEYMVIFERNK